jgi:hypothetical protein
MPRGFTRDADRLGPVKISGPGNRDSLEKLLDVMMLCGVVRRHAQR